VPTSDYINCIFIGSKGLSWKYSVGKKNDLHAFGYNSAESEPIWMKSGTVWAKSWGLALADFGRNPRSSDSRGSQNFVVVFFGPVNNARFPVWKIVRHFNTTTSIGEVVKTFGTEFWKFYHEGSFFQKTQKLLTKFPGLATSGHHNSAMIKIAGNSLPPPKGAWIGIFKASAQNIKTCVLLKLLESNQILHSDQYSSWAVQTGVLQIQDGERPSSWNMDRRPYHGNGLTDQHEIWQDGAHWPSEL